MIGFVVLSHRAPAQLLRLTRALSQVYEDPPISIHHDFSQSRIDMNIFSPNVRFASPHIKTGWAKWSLVSATLRGIQNLYAFADPEYFVIVSGSDYPICRAEKAISDLTSSDNEAFIDAFPLKHALCEIETRPFSENLSHHRSLENVIIARNRYLRAQLKIPVVRSSSEGIISASNIKLGRNTLPLPFDSVFAPYNENYLCYVGSQWFAGSRDLARILMTPSPEDVALQRWLRSRIAPDESYFQTVICNRSDVRRDYRTFRFVVWNGGGAHPQALGLQHLERIVMSGDHFARKFEENHPVLDAIDDFLGIRT